jgi:hypothetical protein
LPSLWKASTHPRNGFEEGVRVSSPPRFGRPAVSPRLSGIRSSLPRLPEGIGLRHQSNCRLRLHPSLPGQRHKIRLPIAVPPCCSSPPSELRLSSWVTSWGLPLRVPQVPVCTKAVLRRHLLLPRTAKRPARHLCVRGSSVTLRLCSGRLLKRAPFLLRGRAVLQHQKLPHHFHRAMRVHRHRLRHAAHHQPVKSAPSMRSHHDQIRLPQLRRG